MHVAVKPVVTPPLAPTPMPDAALAIKFADVATKDLFSKDRNPAVIIEPPKVEKPKPMPPLPVVYGVLGLPSGTKAIMAVGRGMETRSVRKGDTVGEFKIVSLDPANVVFDWDGQQISRKMDDLIDRSGPACRLRTRRSRQQRQGPRWPHRWPTNRRPLRQDPGSQIPDSRTALAFRAIARPTGTVAAGTERLWFRVRSARWVVTGCRLSKTESSKWRHKYMKTITIAVLCCLPWQSAHRPRPQAHNRANQTATKQLDAAGFNDSQGRCQEREWQLQLHGQRWQEMDLLQYARSGVIRTAAPEEASAAPALR